MFYTTVLKILHISNNAVKMMLRNGKRKLESCKADSYQLKKKYKHRSKQVSLYMNDYHDDYRKFQWLHNVGKQRAREIWWEMYVNGDFKSEEDLVERVKGVTKNSIKNSYVKLIFKSYCDEAIKSMYTAILNVEWIKCSIPEVILQEIAFYAVGFVTTCDHEDCNNSILMANHTELFPPADPNKFGHKYEYYQLEYDKGRSYKYYHRTHPKFSNLLLCDSCADRLSHCHRCGTDHYFVDDERTYNVCMGDHYDKDTSTNYMEPIDFKLCLNCDHCDIHSEDEDLIIVHCDEEDPENIWWDDYYIVPATFI